MKYGFSFIVSFLFLFSLYATEEVKIKVSASLDNTGYVVIYEGRDRDDIRGKLKKAKRVTIGSIIKERLTDNYEIEITAKGKKKFFHTMNSLQVDNGTPLGVLECPELIGILRKYLVWYLYEKHGDDLLFD